MVVVVEEEEEQERWGRGGWWGGWENLLGGPSQLEEEEETWIARAQPTGIEAWCVRERWAGPGGRGWCQGTSAPQAKILKSVLKK